MSLLNEPPYKKQKLDISQKGVFSINSNYWLPIELVPFVTQFLSIDSLLKLFITSPYLLFSFCNQNNIDILLQSLNCSKYQKDEFIKNLTKQIEINGINNFFLIGNFLRLSCLPTDKFKIIFNTHLIQLNTIYKSDDYFVLKYLSLISSYKLQTSVAGVMNLWDCSKEAIIYFLENYSVNNPNLKYDVEGLLKYKKGVETCIQEYISLGSSVADALIIYYNHSYKNKKKFKLLLLEGICSDVALKFIEEFKVDSTRLRVLINTFLYSVNTLHLSQKHAFYSLTLNHDKYIRIEKGLKSGISSDLIMNIASYYNDDEFNNLILILLYKDNFKLSTEILISVYEACNKNLVLFRKIQKVLLSDQYTTYSILYLMEVDNYQERIYELLTEYSRKNMIMLDKFRKYYNMKYIDGYILSSYIKDEDYNYIPFLTWYAKYNFDNIIKVFFQFTSKQIEKIFKLVEENKHNIRVAVYIVSKEL